MAMPNMIYQLSLHLVNAFSVHLAFSPPNPPVSQQDCCAGNTLKTDSLFEKRVQFVTFLSKGSVWFFTCLNTIGTLSSHEFSLSPCSMGRFSQSDRTPGSIHPILILGTALALFSAVLRLWCYKTLGHLFTFEITIRPKHELIMHGPYAHVRHPSYTGVYLTLIGSTCVLLAPGTWTAEQGIHTSVGAVFLCLWLLKCAFAFRGTAIRLSAEDELLHANFGEEWENYAKRVPYKLIPGVY